MTATPLMALGSWMYSRYKFCAQDDCEHYATHQCESAQPTCDKHKSSCCAQFRTHGDQVRGAPWRLLEDAWEHVERRLIDLSNRKQSHKTKCSQKWLGKWMEVIQREMTRRKLMVIRGGREAKSETGRCTER